MNNCQLDCAKHCYLLQLSQKVISTIYSYYHQSTVSEGNRACHQVYKRGRQSSRGKGRTGSVRKRNKGEIKHAGFHPRLSSSAAEWGFACRKFPETFPPESYEGINQGFTQPGPDTLTTSQTSTRQKTKSTAGVTRSGKRQFELPSKTVQTRHEYKHYIWLQMNPQMLVSECTEKQREHSLHLIWWKTSPNCLSKV